MYKLPAGKMSEMEHDLGRLGDAPILPYIIGERFPDRGIRAGFSY